MNTVTADELISELQRIIGAQSVEIAKLKIFTMKQSDRIIDLAALVEDFGELLRKNGIDPAQNAEEMVTESTE